MILLGVAAGTVAAYMAGSYVETQLFGVKAADSSVFAVGVLTLLTAAHSVIAAYAARIADSSDARASARMIVR